MLSRRIVCSGAKLNLYFLTGDPRCTALEGMRSFIETRKNPEDAGRDLIAILRYIADHGKQSPRNYFECMINRDRLWAVRKARFRMYGFLSGPDLYLCTHDECKRQRSANQRILDRTQDLAHDWEAQERL